jgi:hypothetical protein
LISEAKSPTYSKFSFFLTNALKIRFRTLSAAESDAVEVNVSSVEKLSGSATVTYSLPGRRQEAPNISAPKRTRIYK